MYAVYLQLNKCISNTFLYFYFSLGKASVKAFQSSILLSDWDYHFSKMNTFFRLLMSSDVPMFLYTKWNKTLVPKK